MATQFYTLTKAVQIAGFTAGNIAQWRIKFPDLAGSEYFSPKAEGKRAAQVDRAGVIFLAIVGRLIRRGLPLPAAAKSAWAFTDMGDITISPEPPGREPCELYPEPARTLMLIAPTAAGGYRVRVVESRHDETFTQLVAGFHSEVLLIVDLNALVARVDTALAVDDDGGDGVEIVAA